MTVLFTELKYCHKPLGYEIAMSAFKFLIRKRLMTNFIFTSSNCVKLQVSHVIDDSSFVIIPFIKVSPQHSILSLL